MNRARYLYSTVVGRRYFLRSIAGLVLGAGAAELSFGAERSSRTASADAEYLIVNGWVLTREDIAFVGTTLNVA
jgi:hypothetical protein